MCDSCQEAFQQIVEGSEPVHPGAPKGREGGVGDDDAAEGDDEEEEEGHEEGGEKIVGGEGGNGLAEANVEKFEHAGHEEHIAGCEACREADTPVLVHVLVPGSGIWGQVKSRVTTYPCIEINNTCNKAIRYFG